MQVQSPEVSDAQAGKDLLIFFVLPTPSAGSAISWSMVGFFLVVEEYMPKIFMGTHNSNYAWNQTLIASSVLYAATSMTLKQEIRWEGFLSGVTFFSLPDDWLCPDCSAGKDEFALVEL